MATVKVNSRSPYYVVASGADGGTIENASVKIVKVTETGDEEGPVSGIYGTDISLKVVATNFTPVSYLWTGGTAAGSTLKQVDFTETGTVNSTIQYGVTARDSAGNPYTATIDVNWSTNAQYTALLQVTNNIIGPSAGYTITSSPTLQYNSATGFLEARITGEDLTSYSFSVSVAANANYTEDTTLALSVSSPITGSFSGADVTETATLTGEVSLDTEYYLSRSTTSVIEGNSFTITLNTINVSNGTSVPFTITGIQAADLQRGTLTGAFVINNSTATQTFQTIEDLSTEGDETFTLTLDNISPAVSTSVTISDSNQNQAQTILVSSSSFDTNTGACGVTATEDAHYGLASGQTFGDGVILYKDMQLSVPYTSSGDYYRIGTSGSYYGRIGLNNPGEITNYAECPVVDDEEDIGGTEPTPTPVVNSISISSQDSSSVGTGGEDPCNLAIDKTVYYTGTIGNGTQLFNNSSLTSPFGGSGLWYKLVIPNSSGTLINWYAKLLPSPSGTVDCLTQCGYNPTCEDVDVGPSLPPTVNVTASNSDYSVNAAASFTSQETIFTATTANISNPSYQWYKGTSNTGGTAALTAISGETSSTLYINRSGGGGETQTTP